MGLLVVPQPATRVEFWWLLIKDGAQTITEDEKGSDPQRVYKYLDLEPDLDGLPRELACYLLGWGALGVSERLPPEMGA